MHVSSKPAKSDQLPDLREFIKENDQKLYDFCFYMLYGGMDIDDVILSIFREFGDHYRRLSGRSSTKWEPAEFRFKLFQIAWDHIRDELSRWQISWTVGRDTRQLKGMDEDLLQGYRGKNFAELEVNLMERLSRIDPDFRAPIVLKDVLRFDDEMVARVLGLRWGVYRHRLHRGRLELKDSLRGRAITSEARGVTLSLNPNATV